MRRIYYLAATLILLMTSCSESKDNEILSETMQVESNVSSRIRSADEAGKIAARFMKTMTAKSTRSGEKRVKAVSLLPPKTETRSEEATGFYNVSFEDGGYALVSTQARYSNPVVVYSEDGKYDAKKDIVTQIYLDYADDILNSIEKENENDSTGVRRRANVPYPGDLPIGGGIVINGVECNYYVRSITTRKDPLLKSEWHQWEPYNRKCALNSLDTIFGHQPTGCVAVAMGQICGFHHWPESLAGVNFDWNLLLSIPSYTPYMYWESADPIAYLLKEIGTMVHTEYADSTASSNINYAFDAFKELGYKDVKRVSFSTQTCLNELSSNRPVYVRGVNKTGDKAHAFVIDGCNSLDTWTEYYRKDNGELYMTEPGNGYVYLHFNKGLPENSTTNYLMSGRGITNGGEPIQNYNFSNSMQLITNIYHE